MFDRSFVYTKEEENSSIVFYKETNGRLKRLLALTRTVRTESRSSDSVSYRFTKEKPGGLEKYQLPYHLGCWDNDNRRFMLITSSRISTKTKEETIEKASQASQQGSPRIRDPGVLLEKRHQWTNERTNVGPVTISNKGSFRKIVDIYIQDSVFFIDTTMGGEAITPSIRFTQ